MATFTKISDQLKELTEGWSKWNIALFVGAPIALGVAGLWYFKRSAAATKKEDIGIGDGARNKSSSGAGKVSKSASKQQQGEKPQVCIWLHVSIN